MRSLIVLLVLSPIILSACSTAPRCTDSYAPSVPINTPAVEAGRILEKRYPNSLASVSRESQYVVASYRVGVYDQLNDYALRNFPSEAHGRYGAGLAISTIGANGQVLEVSLLRSSGDPVLDRAFLKVFCRPDGYGEFSESLRKKTTVLHISLPFSFTNDSLRNDNP